MAPRRVQGFGRKRPDFCAHFNPKTDYSSSNFNMLSLFSKPYVEKERDADGRPALLDGWLFRKKQNRN